MEMFPSASRSNQCFQCRHLIEMSTRLRLMRNIARFIEKLESRAPLLTFRRSKVSGSVADRHAVLFALGELSSRMPSRRSPR